MLGRFSRHWQALPAWRRIVTIGAMCLLFVFDSCDQRMDAGPVDPNPQVKIEISIGN